MSLFRVVMLITVPNVDYRNLCVSSLGPRLWEKPLWSGYFMEVSISKSADLMSAFFNHGYFNLENLMHNILDKFF